MNGEAGKTMQSVCIGTVQRARDGNANSVCERLLRRVCFLEFLSSRFWSQQKILEVWNILKQIENMLKYYSRILEFSDFLLKWFKATRSHSIPAERFRSAFNAIL